jgi:hypothetical protein
MTTEQTILFALLVAILQADCAVRMGEEIVIAKAGEPVARLVP